MCTMPIITVRVNPDSRYEIISRAVRCGCDWNVSVCGGSRHHIGAVTIYSPETSSCPESPELSLSFPGHKDIFVSQLFAREFLQAFHSRVVVSAGIHIDHATQEEIQLLIQSSKKCCQLLLQAIAQGDSSSLPGETSSS